MSVMLRPSGPSTTTETETVAKYEIMDGAPVKGESIPIRLFLAGNASLCRPPGFLVYVLAHRVFCVLLGYDLTPTMRDVNKKFSVRYFLNLVLVDEEDRRYFKQQVSHSQMLHSWFLTHCLSLPLHNGLCFAHLLLFVFWFCVLQQQSFPILDLIKVHLFSSIYCIFQAVKRTSLV